MFAVAWLARIGGWHLLAAAAYAPDGQIGADALARAAITIAVPDLAAATS
jgi:hypothetical protein